MIHNLRVIHHLLRARDYQDRIQFHTLCEWWRRSRGSAAGVAALVGIGGAGKTALTERFVRTIPSVLPPSAKIPYDSTLPTPDGLFVFSFYDAPNTDAFFSQLAAYLRKEKHDDSAKPLSYEQTIQLFRTNESHLLIMDGLEVVQEDGLRGTTFGRLSDGRLRDFLIRVADAWLPRVSIVVTTRFRLFDVIANRCDHFLSIPIEKLDTPSAIALLRARGVKGNDSVLEPIAEEQGFHALTVDLMGGYIKYFCDGFPERLPPLAAQTNCEQDLIPQDPELTHVREQERRFMRVAARYIDAFRDRDPSALALLQRVCLFRLGVTAELLASVFTGTHKSGVAGDALAQLTLRELRNKLNLLSEMRLLEASESVQSPLATVVKSRLKATVSYSIHPAVRDGFFSSLDVRDAKLGHAAACKTMQTSLSGLPGDVYPTAPETLDLIEEVIYHTLQSGDNKAAWELYTSRLGGYQHLGASLASSDRGDRICRAFVGGHSPFSDSLATKLGMPRLLSHFLNGWSLYLSDIGQNVAARRCLSVALEERSELQDSSQIARLHRNLAGMLIRSGLLQDAERTLKEATKYTSHRERYSKRREPYSKQRDVDVLEQKKLSLEMATVFALRGDTPEAMEEFAKASQYEDAKSPSGITGIEHARLLARLRRFVEAMRVVDAHDRLCTITTGNMEHPNSPSCNLLRAEIASCQGDFDSASKFLRLAREWAINHSIREVLCSCSLTAGNVFIRKCLTGKLAESSILQSELKDVERTVDEGLRWAAGSEYGLLSIDLLCCRSRLMSFRGQTAGALETIRLILQSPSQRSTSEYNVLPANDRRCGYRWGEAEARQILGELLALSGHDGRHQVVNGAVEAAKKELAESQRLRERMGDPRSEECGHLLRQLEEGNIIRSGYPTIQFQGQRGDNVSATVFISYSRKDVKWLERFQIGLRPLVRRDAMVVWDDSRIKPGALWKKEITEALSSAKVALLLVSPDFLASDFIANHELAPILQAASRNGLSIVWVPLRASLYDETEISQFQAAYDPSTPLASLDEAALDEAILRICKMVKSAAQQ